MLRSTKEREHLEVVCKRLMLLAEALLEFSNTLCYW